MAQGTPCRSRSSISSRTPGIHGRSAVSRATMRACTSSNTSCAVVPSAYSSAMISAVTIDDEPRIGARCSAVNSKTALGQHPVLRLVPDRFGVDEGSVEVPQDCLGFSQH